MPFEIIRWLSIFGASFAFPPFSTRIAFALRRRWLGPAGMHDTRASSYTASSDTRYRIAACSQHSALLSRSVASLTAASGGLSGYFLFVNLKDVIYQHAGPKSTPVIAGVECPHTARLSVHRRSSRHARAIPTVTLSVRVVWVLHAYTSRVLVPTEYSSTCRATQGKPGRQLWPVLAGRLRSCDRSGRAVYSATAALVILRHALRCAGGEWALCALMVSGRSRPPSSAAILTLHAALSIFLKLYFYK